MSFYEKTRDNIDDFLEIIDVDRMNADWINLKEDWCQELFVVPFVSNRICPSKK